VSVAEDRDIPMPSEKPLAKRRRLAAQRVREARERLTSTTGTSLAFDYELLRQFAENRLSASLVVLLLIGTVGFLSGLWIGATAASLWTATVLAIHALIVNNCRQFLSERDGLFGGVRDFRHAYNLFLHSGLRQACIARRIAPGKVFRRSVAIMPRSPIASAAKSPASPCR